MKEVLFIVTGIFTVRDGRSIAVKTTAGDFFLCKKDFTIHSALPIDSTNQINDFLFVSYFLSRIEDYLIKSEVDLLRQREIFKKLELKYD